MSTKTKQEAMAKLTQKYVKAGAEYRVKLLDQVVELTGCHRQSAIRALNKKPRLNLETAMNGRKGAQRAQRQDFEKIALFTEWESG